MKYLVLSLLLLIHIVSAKLSYWSSSYWYAYSSYHHSRQPKTNVFIHDCSTSDYVLHIQSIKITPDIVTAGGELTIESTGTLDEPLVPGAKADVLVKLGAVKLLHKTFDICDELDKKKDDVEIQCPIEKGDLTISQKVTLPKEVPRAKFGVIVHAFTAEDKPLACLDITVDFRIHPSRFLQLQE